MKTGASLIVVTFALCACRPSPPKELDLANKIVGAKEIPFGSRPSTRTVVSTLDLREGFIATVAHGYFTSDPDTEIDFVEISIAYPSSGGSYACLIKAFALDDLPQDILSRSAGQIVSITQDHIVFDLETTTITADKPWNY